MNKKLTIFALTISGLTFISQLQGQTIEDGQSKSSINSKLSTIRTEAQKKLNDQLIKKDADRKERLNTILSCENFSDSLAMYCIDIDYNVGETNYGYGAKLFGYINIKGNVTIAPSYEKAFPFSNGFALVNIDSRYSNNWEFINPKGENIFNRKFADANSFAENFAAIRTENRLYGFIDKSGSFISKPQYEEVGDFKEGVARVKLQNKWGYIDSTGKEIIYPQFTYARDFSDGLALISQSNEQYSYINKAGKVVIKFGEKSKPVLSTGHSSFGMRKDENIEISFCDFYNGIAMVNVDRTQGNFGFSGTIFINKAGKTAVKPWDSYENIYHYNEGLALAQKYVGKQYGYLNNKGNWSIEPIFDEAGNFHEGLAKVQINENWGFVNATGNVVINKDILKSKTDIKINPSYDEVSDFSEGLAIVKIRKKLGYIDKSGNWIIKPELIGASLFKNGIARVKLADRKGWNYIDKNGKILFTNFL